MTEEATSGSLRAARAALAEDAARDVEAGVDGRELCRRITARLDALLVSLWARAPASQGAELACVGSYGRGTPGPASDLDLRVLVTRGDGAPIVDALLYPLWDGGFSVGHQVVRPRELAELAHADLSTATATLDLRHLAGDHLARAPKLDAERLRAQLREDAASRQRRFGDSPYLLEPEVKLGTGGLRDIDAIRWAHAAAGTALSDHDAAAIDAAEELLLRVRNRLHARAGRRSDRLSFDAQEALAIAMGYGEPGADVSHAAERLMQDYYRAARAVAIVRERTLAPQVKRARPKDLGRGLVRAGDHVGIKEGALEADPSIALRLFLERDPLLPEAEDAIARACSDATFAARLRASSEAARALVTLVCQPRADHPLARAHDAGALVAMIPELVPVTGRVHHDVYHVLTVDAHSLAAVAWLGALVRGELASEHPIATHLAVEVARPRVLFMATLLHDVGKGYPDASGSRKDHSRRGAELVDEILPRLGCSPEETRRARALVLHHLTMYRIASRRDLDDPAVIAELANVVRARETLRELYLLTLADIATTAPTALTSWKASMLEQLYVRTDALLSGAPQGASETESLAAQVLTAARAEERDVVRSFLRGMPERYLAAHAPEAIVRHARLAMSRRGPCAMALVPSRYEGTLELNVVAFDAPGLLAKIAAALAANRLEVLAAQVHSLDHDGARSALDVFFVRHLKEGDPEDAVRAARRDLERMLQGALEPRALLAERLATSPWRERPNPAVRTQIVIDRASSPLYTIVEVVTKDRPGLLFALALALHELGLSITLAKLTTEGAKAIDVFYVTERDGTKDESEQRLADIRATLEQALA